jgi:hypothetical protein
MKKSIMWSNFKEHCDYYFDKLVENTAKNREDAIYLLGIGASNTETYQAILLEGRTRTLAIEALCKKYGR